MLFHILGFLLQESHFLTLSSDKFLLVPFDMELDDISLQSKKISKAEKKLWQKQMKARYTLLKHEGIECVSYPTKVIRNCNFYEGVHSHTVLSIAHDFTQNRIKA